jgi:hypothetical protein
MFSIGDPSTSALPIVVGDNHHNSQGYVFIASNYKALKALGYRRFVIESHYDDAPATLEKCKEFFSDFEAWKARFVPHQDVLDLPVSDDGRFLISERKYEAIKPILKLHFGTEDHRNLVQLCKHFGKKSVWQGLMTMLEILIKDSEIQVICAKAPTGCEDFVEKTNMLYAKALMPNTIAVVGYAHFDGIKRNMHAEGKTPLFFGFKKCLSDLLAQMGKIDRRQFVEVCDSNELLKLIKICSAPGGAAASLDDTLKCTPFMDECIKIGITPLDAQWIESTLTVE